MSDESVRRSRTAVNTYSWLVCAKIVKCGKVEKDPTQGGIFSAGNEPTQDSGVLEGFESTQTDPWEWRGGSAPSAGPYEVYTAISNVVGLVNPTGLKFVKPLRSYSVAGSGKWARNIGDVVGAAVAVLKCPIERGDELKLPLDACNEGPHFANAFLCLVAGGYAERCSPQYPRRRLGAQTMWPVPNPRGFQCLSESSFARLMNTIFILNETSSGGTVSPTKRGRVLKAQGQSRRQELCPKLHGFQLARSETPITMLNERWPLLTARPRRGQNFLVFALAVQVRNRLGEAGCADPVALSRIASRTAVSASPTKFFCPLLAWVVGPEAIGLETNAQHRVQRAAFSQKLVVRAQKAILFTVGFCVNLT